MEHCFVNFGSLVPRPHPLQGLATCTFFGPSPFCCVCVTMVSVGHLRSSSLSNRVVAELERLIGQKVKMA